ncbi:ABC transporter ATP-binding protein [Conexibacter sp. CPCC 206217]|uniref:ABC transporter ATP-binding protein n=1 Tax=Conexibacter sp. CPCC 206217 TaxID=3064574 RepID=UPI0027182250|nr:ATP-binding cassette domain-containing protein [Conexibacter sp. CPCC 206217]MDO8212555.1 ATP-binding cassette domain-containing protein [Conexibacter sp. CPCC 206217]
MPAIELRGVSKRYGRQQALAAIDLRVECGEVFGFIGPNGAGKTTTIRLLLDLIRPSGGDVRVLGLDARRDGVEVRRRVGYLPGELALYEDLTAAQLLGHLAALRGAGAAAIAPLAERLSLELERPIRTLSKGNKQKVGLVQAFMHRPELLILDEPTGGLDPLVQREFGRMLEEARERGQTVFLSSHVLSEVDRLADRVALVREGRVALVDDVAALKARLTRRLELRFEQPPPAGAFERLPGVAGVEHAGAHVTLTLDGPADAVVKEAARHRVLTLASREPDLDDLFLQLLDDSGGSDAR